MATSRPRLRPNMGSWVCLGASQARLFSNRGDGGGPRPDTSARSPSQNSAAIPRARSLSSPSPAGDVTMMRNSLTSSTTNHGSDHNRAVQTARERSTPAAREKPKEMPQADRPPGSTSSCRQQLTATRTWPVGSCRAGNEMWEGRRGRVCMSDH